MRGERSRVARLRAFTEDKWGEPEILADAIFAEGSRNPGWRVKRAAMVHAESEGVWMTADEFSAWVDGGRLLARRWGAQRPEVAIGLPRKKRLAYEKGSTQVPKPVALACAHWAFNLAPPPIETSAQLDAWFAPRFGDVPAVEAWLDMSKGLLGDYLRGWQSRAGGRVAREPYPVLIRALDWVWKKGPVLPYGNRPVSVFPGQKEPPR